MTTRVALLALLFSSCAHAPTPMRAAPAAPAAAPTKAPAPLPGWWTSGTGAEPPPGAVHVTRPCGRTVTRWQIDAEPSSFHAILVQGTALTGTPHALPIRETIVGEIHGDDLTPLVNYEGQRGPQLESYVLHLDRGAQRIRGTKNGTPIWFAPLEVAEPTGCTAEPAGAPFDVNGDWVGTQAWVEPAEPEIVRQEDCSGYPGGWILESRDGREIESIIIPPIANQGIPSPPLSRVAARGTIQGRDITIDGPEGTATVHYRLRYDPETGHLRGTRNGQHFVATRLRLIRADCLPVP